MNRDDAFLVMFAEEGDTRRRIRSILDASPIVDDWVYFMPGVFAVSIHEPKRELYKMLKAALPGMIFYIAELKSDGASGVLPGPVWDMIRGPERRSA